MNKVKLSIGDRAPEFTLFNQNTELVSLSDFRGEKVIMLFFPFANTSVCTKEMCKFRDELKLYERLNAKVLGISVDSPFSLKMWAEKNNYQFHLLSDFNREVSRAYGTLSDVFAPGKFNFAGVSKRSAFVINEIGILKYVEVLENPGDEPDYLKIKQSLE